MATPLPMNEACFSAEEIVLACEAERIGSAPGPMSGVVIDSRAVRPGVLFVAIVGETHDAHDYVAAALEAGAAAAIVSRPVEGIPDGAALFRVADTLEALGRLAAFHRRRFDLPVIGLTGSVGKTTTRTLIEAGLRALGVDPLATRGNLNNRVGLPMTLLGLSGQHRAALLELGMSVPGEIAKLAEIAAPTVGVLTSIAAVHIAGVGDLDGVAAEKGALLAALPVEGTVVSHADDARVRAAAAASPARRRIGFGRSERADMRVREIELRPEGETFMRIEVGARRFEGVSQLLGEAAATSASAALAVIHALFPDRLDEAWPAILAADPAPGRMEARRGPEGCLLIDDAYNASPIAVEAALLAGRDLASARGGRLLVALGDMLELGSEHQRAHESVGRAVVDCKAALFVACGEGMALAARAALGAGALTSAKKTRVLILPRGKDGAVEAIREMAAAEDVILIKGSRGMRMDTVVEGLVEPREGEER